MSSRSKPLSATGVAALMRLGLLAAACAVVPEDDRPPSRPAAICTREYVPVCGQRGRDLETFANACMARSEGFRVRYRGQCEREPPDRPERPTMCPMIYQPVCAARGGSVRTFGNACSAGGEGYRVIRNGPC